MSVAEKRFNVAGVIESKQPHTISPSETLFWVKWREAQQTAKLSHGWRHWNCNASTAHSFPVFKEQLSSVGGQRLQEREHDKVAQYFYYPTVHLASFTCGMLASKGLLLAVPRKLCFYLGNNTLAKSLHHCSLLPSFPP